LLKTFHSIRNDLDKICLGLVRETILAPCAPTPGYVFGKTMFSRGGNPDWQLIELINRLGDEFAERASWLLKGRGHSRFRGRQQIAHDDLFLYLFVSCCHCAFSFPNGFCHQEKRNNPTDCPLSMRRGRKVQFLFVSWIYFNNLIFFSCCSCLGH
jgi:hypothetical protein